MGIIALECDSTSWLNKSLFGFRVCEATAKTATKRNIKPSYWLFDSRLNWNDSSSDQKPVENKNWQNWSNIWIRSITGLEYKEKPVNWLINSRNEFFHLSETIKHLKHVDIEMKNETKKILVICFGACSATVACRWKRRRKRVVVVADVPQFPFDS